MSRLKSIDEEWQGFSGMIFAKMKPPPGPVQVEECKKAFFAGAWAMLNAVRLIGEPEISEAEGMKYLDDRQREGKEFYRDLIKRYSEAN